MGRRDLAAVLHAGQLHRAEQLLTQAIQHPPRSVFASHSEAKKERPADENRPRAERERAENVLASPDSSVYVDFAALAEWIAAVPRFHGAAHRPQRVCRPFRPV